MNNQNRRNLLILVFGFVFTLFSNSGFSENLSSLQFGDEVVLTKTMDLIRVDSGHPPKLVKFMEGAILTFEGLYKVSEAVESGGPNVRNIGYDIYVKYEGSRFRIRNAEPYLFSTARLPVDEMDKAYSEMLSFDGIQSIER
ncbi:hypothetical protein GW916_10180 [bacterium]|nr:hypothetical protein [bacterium]